MVFYILSTTIIQNNTIFFNQNAKITQGVGLNQASLIINETIRTATRVVLTNGVYNTSNQVLVLALPSLDNNGNADITHEDFFVITADSNYPNVLRQIIFPSPISKRAAENRVLLTDLSNINFAFQDINGNTVPPDQAARVKYTLVALEQAFLNVSQNQTVNIVNLRNKQ